MLRKVVNCFLAVLFAFMMGANFAPPSEAEASHRSFWDDIQRETRHEAVRLYRQTLREYSDQFLRSIKDRNRWERQRREIARRNGGRYEQPNYVYVIAAHGQMGQNIELGSMSTSKPLDVREETALQNIANAISSGEPIYLPKTVDRALYRRLASEMGLNVITENRVYLYFSR